MLSKLVFLSFVCLSAAIAQAPQTLPEIEPSSYLADVCKAPVIAKDTEPLVVEVIRKKLGPYRPKAERIRTVVVQSDVVNAYTFNVGPDRAIICIPTATIAVMDGAEAELAFIMGHEIGHALDKACKSNAGRTAVSNSTLPVLQQRECEKRADEIGFALLRKAGYSPFAAAGAFGRLEMLQKGGTRTGLLARLRQGDHPITPDRIENLHRLLLEDAAASALNP